MLHGRAIDDRRCSQPLLLRGRDNHLVQAQCRRGKADVASSVGPYMDQTVDGFVADVADMEPINSFGKIVEAIVSLRR